MGKILVENYDGEKGYIGKDKFNVVNLDGKTYLLSAGTYNVGSWSESASDFEVYKILKVRKDLLDCANAMRIRNKKTLVEIVKKRTKDLNNTKIPCL